MATAEGMRILNYELRILYKLKVQSSYRSYATYLLEGLLIFYHTIDATRLSIVPSARKFGCKTNKNLAEVL